MIINLEFDTPLPAIEALCDRLSFMGFTTQLYHHDEQPIIMVLQGIDATIDQSAFSDLPYVKSVSFSNEKYKLVGRHLHSQPTKIKIGGHQIGGGPFVAMAGPCTIESEDQIHTIARLVASKGATILRGGAFKPRTSPYDFQGLGEPGLRFMRDAARANGMLSISEVMQTEEVDLLTEYVDILQVGARNMQNYSLLKRLGSCGKPVFLKRGLSATYHEFLSAAEYLLAHGNPEVILCERGVRTFETLSRNTLDIGAVPFLRELTHLPIVIDPSHACGRRTVVPALSYAAAAVQADGIMVEVHTDPDRSVSDAAQAITPETFEILMKKCNAIHEVMNAI